MSQIRLKKSAPRLKAPANACLMRYRAPPTRAQHQTRRLGERVSGCSPRCGNFYRETPLAAGAIAFALGALIGGVTPLSQPERDRLRGVVDKAARTGADLAERGARMVGDGLESAVH